MHTILEIRKEYNRLDELCGVDTSKVRIEFSDRMIRSYGICSVINRVPRSIKIASFLREEDEVFWNTIRHEYAHALVVLRHPREKHVHDQVWKDACIEIGCNPQRLAASCEGHTKKAESAAKYKIVCPSCGKTYIFQRATKSVKALQSGISGYRCSACKEKDLQLITL